MPIASASEASSPDWTILDADQLASPFKWGSVDDAAYGAAPRAISGVTHCDRNLFAGDAPALYRFWKSSGRAGV